MNSLFHGFRHYADFSGRDTRGQFWGFILSTQIISLILLIPIIIFSYHMLADAFRAMMEQNLAPGGRPLSNEEILALIPSFFTHGIGVILFTILITLWQLVIIVPTAATTVRRLRDAGQSPWWVLPPLLTFTPLVVISSHLMGLPPLLCIVTLVMCCLPTAPAPRQPEPDAQ